MSLLRQVARNTAVQFAGKFIGTALGFGAVIILNRYLGDEKNGNYITAMTYLQLFGIVMDLGLYVILLKHIATKANADHRLFHNIFTFRLVTALLFLFIACTTVWLIPNFPEIVKLAVVVVAINYLFITLNQLFLAVYQQGQNLKRVALAEIAGKFIMFLSTLLVVYVWQAGLLAVMGAIVAGGFTQTLILWFGLRRYTTMRLAFDFKIWRQVFMESWPVALAIALNLVYFKSDSLLLALFHSQKVVGIYGAPYKMLEVLITLPAMVVGLLMPVLSQAFVAGNIEKFRQLYARSINFLLIMALPMVVGSMILAQPIMLLVAGKDYTDNPLVLGQLLSVLIIAVGMIFVGTLTGYVVVIINQQRAILWGYGFVAATALCGYLWLIPSYSYYGAAAVTVYSETTMVLIASWLIYRTTKARPQLLGPAKIAAATGIMGILVWWLANWPL
ncbi:MAG: heteropolysaccharide repeat-containing protein, partial [uncultured bacterium]